MGLPVVARPVDLVAHRNTRCRDRVDQPHRHENGPAALEAKPVWCAGSRGTDCPESCGGVVCYMGTMVALPNYPPARMTVAEFLGWDPGPPVSRYGPPEGPV